MAFLKKNFKDARATLASPFDRMQVAVDELKEKFGKMLLPMVINFVDYLTKNVVPAVSGFLDQLANPKTDVGKIFVDIKNAVKDAFNQLKNFFAFFGQGDAIKGFGNIAKSLVQMLPALIAFKSIMVLAKAGKGIANIVAAVAALRGGNAANDVTNSPIGGSVKAIAVSQALDFAATEGNRREIARQSGQNFTLFSGGSMALPSGIFNNPKAVITINSYGSTPAQFNNLVKKALDEHNRLNGKK
jgi:hypothetical protein